MAEKAGLAQRWQNTEPTKTFVFWACVISVAIALFIGFNWGGWVTGGTAREMAATAADRARAELAVASCLDRFGRLSDADTHLGKLRETSAWQRGTYVEEAGWVTIAGTNSPVDDAGELCAEEILAAAPAAEKASTVN